jgi:hypothetical protein
MIQSKSYLETECILSNLISAAIRFILNNTILPAAERQSSSYYDENAKG